MSSVNNTTKASVVNLSTSKGGGGPYFILLRRRVQTTWTNEGGKGLLKRPQHLITAIK